MLDSETKSRIDSARDILVGKVPDPKSQVEQITIALIYKFMDDMDRQSEELGGKASFFTGKFKQYRWAQLLDKRFSGHERLLLYAEGIEKMNENKNIPQLFRDIFKGVFLPYRDPETLNLFLKEIDGFSYEHSERLGDAYEYLLSVLGTQGEAGQFRTPRHIIDFIVAVLDPKKSETVLDPACGTAGFLISAYKHILYCGSRIANCGLNKEQISNSRSKIQNQLTPDERARLMTNFRGYDIAPDMVRLSRVNLYLHGFPNPIIHEYDTLTSEERWDERCDVIMANPPFMSPKGGIRPHNRFSIKAKRSEVLFVDYIAEHLNPGGRAGVIVPEGIIFQSQNAYKSLRKMLVENYLWAVVSLPSGLFNPYSGVKTSILFLDRNLAKRTDEVLFVKIENDGFDLGAQRRPIEGSQLAEALKILDGHKKASAYAKASADRQEGKMALIVTRKRLLESSDFNLSGERYRVAALRVAGKWPIVRLGQITSEFISGGTPSTSVPEYWSGNTPWITGADVVDRVVTSGRKWISEDAVRNSATHIVPKGAILLVSRTGVGKLAKAGSDIAISQDLTGVVLKNGVNVDYVITAITHGIAALQRIQQGSTIRGVLRSDIEALEIPLPPLEEQERIVEELEGYRKVIEGARQILANYKPTIKIDPKWPMVKLGDLCEKILSGGTPSTNNDKYWNGDIPWITSADIIDEKKVNIRKYITKKGMEESATNLIPKGNIIVVTRVGLGKILLTPFNLCISQDSQGLIIQKEQVLSEYLLYILKDLVMGFKSQSQGTTIQGVTKAQLNNLQIHLPPLSIQRRIVEEIEWERKLVEANRELIARMEAKLKAKLAEVWGETGN